jgi:hypothetical protein
MLMSTAGKQRFYHAWKKMGGKKQVGYESGLIILARMNRVFNVLIIQ